MSGTPSVPLTFADITDSYISLVGPATDAMNLAREKMAGPDATAKDGLEFQAALQQWTMVGSMAHESMSSLARTMEEMISQR
jgi:hypothetical protein